MDNYLNNVPYNVVWNILFKLTEKSDILNVCKMVNNKVCNNKSLWNIKIKNELDDIQKIFNLSPSFNNYFALRNIKIRVKRVIENLRRCRLRGLECRIDIYHENLPDLSAFHFVESIKKDKNFKTIEENYKSNVIPLARERYIGGDVQISYHLLFNKYDIRIVIPQQGGIDVWHFPATESEIRMILYKLLQQKIIVFYTREKDIQERI